MFVTLSPGSGSERVVCVKVSKQFAWYTNILDILELEMKVKGRFAKISQSQRRPLLLLVECTY